MSSVLFVYAAAGPSVDYALPRLARHARVVTVLMVRPSEEVRQVLGVYSSEIVDFTTCIEMRYESVRDELVRIAKKASVDAVLTLAELAVELVADVAAVLGLRGAGPNAVFSRDKVKMRERWADAGVPEPRFHAVRSSDDLLEAMKLLRRPFIVKHAGSAGSIGHMLVRDGDDADRVLAAVRGAIAAAAQRGVRAYHEHGEPHFIAEELIDASAARWYDHGRFGDYVSVEGLVIEGRYFPVCIVGRFPSIPNFIEYGNFTPCPLPDSAANLVEAAARQAVDALGLECCATHTEIKLGSDGQPYLVESAARMGGATITRMVEESFGVDLVGALVCTLLGQAPALPQRMLHPADARRACVNLPVLGATPAGVPWREAQLFYRNADWGRLLSGRTAVEVSWGQSLPDSSAVPTYDPPRGVLNYAARLFLSCDDFGVLVEDAQRLANNMEFLLADERRARGEEVDLG